MQAADARKTHPLTHSHAQTPLPPTLHTHTTPQWTPNPANMPLRFLSFVYCVTCKLSALLMPRLDRQFTIITSVIITINAYIHTYTVKEEERKLSQQKQENDRILIENFRRYTNDNS